jgi:3-hydroxybutyryl-CoA dehydratase
MNIEEITVGMSESYTQTITDENVVSFANISGDKNPIHIDEAYAKVSRFKRRIAHGMISSSFFSALFGTKLPGAGCLYISQNLNFKKVVYIGDTVTATVIVKKVDIVNKRVAFDTICKVGHRTVIDGEAELYIP